MKNNTVEIKLKYKGKVYDTLGFDFGRLLSDRISEKGVKYGFKLLADRCYEILERKR